MGRRGLIRRLAAVIGFVALATGLAGVVLYRSATSEIDRRLAAPRWHSVPRVLARRFELRPGLAVSDRQLVDRLNDLGYTHRPRALQPGDFAIGRNVVVLAPRTGTLRGRVVRVVFRPAPQAVAVGTAGGSLAGPPGPRIERLAVVGGTPLDRLELEAPVIAELATETRARRRSVALDRIPRRVVQAVLSIEDRRFYDHWGVDPVRMVGALVTNVRGDRPYLVGGSTVTQQLVKNAFLTPEKTFRRKVREQAIAIVLERRLSKNAILALYLNEVYLGHHGSFAIHGMAEGARVFFGKDVANLTLAEAATLAGVIQSPQTYSPFRFPDRARRRRNVVLDAMVECGYLDAGTARRAASEPLRFSARSVETDAPYFVDHVTRLVAEKEGNAAGMLELHTTLDFHLQRLAEEAVREGLAEVDRRLARRKPRRQAQAALVAIDPRDGSVLALVGGRSYAQSQYNRATGARRQPGSAFKPFVYLAAFDRAVAEGWLNLTPASVVTDEPTSFTVDDRTWSPRNYDGDFVGPLTLRRALALSRNVPAVKVGEAAGFERVSALWGTITGAPPPRPYPAIALGVFESTPLELAAAYTIFPNAGRVRPLRWIDRVVDAEGRTRAWSHAAPRGVVRPQAAFIVTGMLQSVLDEGTASSARARGFTRQAAGKTGTTNDLRDAWFAGFTPELLTVVWVGLDDNHPLGLTGAEAALPMWTTFMSRALSGRQVAPFAEPDGITHADIDPETGRLATPWCPRVIREAFVSGSEPFVLCELHPQ